MNQQKRARLEAAGWKLGSAAEFLDLSEAEAAIVEVKLGLARALRDRRVRRNLTQAEAGRLLGSSQSRVAKMEAGDRSVTIDLLVRSLFKLGGDPQELARCFAPPTKRRAA